MAYQFNDLENEITSFDFRVLENDVESTKKSFAANTPVRDTKLCEVWKHIGKFIRPLAHIPVVGKFVAILVEVLDSVCPA